MIIRLSALGSLAAAIALGGCAANGGTRTTAEAAAAAPSSCLTATGSRVPASPGYCTAVGRSYSSTDIRNTGASNPGEALRLMDPSISVGH